VFRRRAVQTKAGGGGELDGVTEIVGVTDGVTEIVGVGVAEMAIVMPV